ncbi:hypothetical protein FA09DRAFT_328126 [Tilletiopsis washingtonensis]|uniref:Fibronectin type-III domain-containing protein n=1 Tax=Tilletiopsis washingtonensis TaxID=58919 RepID=A0A316ZI63_9BASI|nr:hypothetical protein FA09DRAFT_328126 [Tilletiopsis washingtonensis]PWN99985.1 hypothetical protein FA09DRAFT_328126 [Tilletiopsis washingtonensis]
MRLSLLSSLSALLLASLCAAQSSTNNSSSSSSSSTSSSSSNIVITSPQAGDVWYSNSTNRLAWTGNMPSLFSVQILNSNNLILANGLSVFNNVPAAAGSLGVSIGQLAHADGYTVRIYNVNNIAEQYAVSPSFAIHNVSASAGPSSSVTPGYVVPASAASNLPSGVRSSTSGAPSASASGFGTFSGSGSGGEFWVVWPKRRGACRKAGGAMWG